MKNLRTVIVLAVIVAMPFVVTTSTAWAQQPHADKTFAAIVGADTKPVAWDTFVRAESDKYFHSYVHLGGIGNFYNIRQPTPIDQQKVIRMNRDRVVLARILAQTRACVGPCTADAQRRKVPWSGCKVKRITERLDIRQ